MMFTRSQFLSCSGFLGFLKVIKGDWQEMLPDTWSVLIDGSGSVVLAQAEGRWMAQGSSLALGCWLCRDFLLPGAIGWAKAEGEGVIQPPCPQSLPQVSDLLSLFSDWNSESGAGVPSRGCEQV